MKAQEVSKEKNNNNTNRKQNHNRKKRSILHAHILTDC